MESVAASKPLPQEISEFTISQKPILSCSGQFDFSRPAAGLDKLCGRPGSNKHVLDFGCMFTESFLGFVYY